MRQFLYALMAFCAFGLLSCRKSGTDLTIKQFDSNQIQNYIQQNGLTGMVRDTSGGDTTGIYYQIISQGTGDVIQYYNKVSYVYSFKTFDGKYNSTDTIQNHANTYAAYIGPQGVGLAIKNIIKRKGGKIRVLIPSRLAYGINGTTITSYNATSGATVVSGTIAGNQCLDYTISVVDDSKQAAYDDASIQKYMALKGLTGFQSDGKGSYYKITNPGTGADAVSLSSTLGVEYTGTLFDGLVFDSATTTDGTAAATFTLYDVNIPAWQSILPKVTAGARVTMLVPSHAAYGQDANASGTTTIPAFSCLRFDFIVVSVSN